MDPSLHGWLLSAWQRALRRNLVAGSTGLSPDKYCLRAKRGKGHGAPLTLQFHTILRRWVSVWRLLLPLSRLLGSKERRDRQTRFTVNGMVPSVSNDQSRQVGTRGCRARTCRRTQLDHCQAPIKAVDRIFCCCCWPMLPSIAFATCQESHTNGAPGNFNGNAN